MRDPLGRDVLFAQVPESLDHEPAEAAGGCHVPRRRPPKLDRHLADRHQCGSGRRSGTRFRRHLLGQSEQVRCVRAGGLKPGPVASGKGFGDDLCGWPQLSKRAVLLRIEVDASGQTPESAGFGQPGEGLVNGCPAGKVDEVRRREHRPSTSAFNSP